MNNYQLYEEIGRGNHSVVYKGRRKKSIDYFAVASLEKSQRQRLQHSVGLLRHVSPHKNIIRFHNWYETTNHLWCITEYCTGGDLRAVLNADRSGLPEASTRCFALDLVEGLMHVHARSVLYNDLKPSNVLIDDVAALRLYDFGLAFSFEDAVLGKGSVGTPAYMAPELFRDDGVHSSASDIWSLGCVILEMASGRPPFVDAALEPLIEKILCEPLGAASRLPQYTASFSELIEGMLQKDPLARFTWKEIVASDFWGADKPVLVDIPTEPGLEQYRRNVHARAATLPESRDRSRARSDALRASINAEHNWKREHMPPSSSSAARNGTPGSTNHRSRQPPPPPPPPQPAATDGTSETVSTSDSAAAAAVGAPPLPLPVTASHTNPRPDSRDINGPSVASTVDVERELDFRDAGTRDREQAGERSLAGRVDPSQGTSSSSNIAPSSVQLVSTVTQPSTAPLAPAAAIVASAPSSTAAAATAVRPLSSPVVDEVGSQPTAAAAFVPSKHTILHATMGVKPNGGESQAVPKSAGVVVTPAGGDAAQPNLSTAPNVGGTKPTTPPNPPPGTGAGGGSQAAATSAPPPSSTQTALSVAATTVCVVPLLQHNSDNAAKPILFNSRIEKQPEAKYEASELPFPARTAAHVRLLEGKELENFLATLYRALSSTACPAQQMHHIVSYLESLCGDSTIVSNVVNSVVLVACVKLLGSDSLPSQTCALVASVIGLLVRHAAFIRPDFQRTNIYPALLTASRAEGAPKLRRKAVACLGEIVFYIASQPAAERAQADWQLPPDVPPAWLLSLADEDEIVRHYAAKALENVCTTGDAAIMQPFANRAMILQLMTLASASSGKSEFLKASAVYAATRLALVVDRSLLPIVSASLLSVRSSASATTAAAASPLSNDSLTSPSAIPPPTAATSIVFLDLLGSNVVKNPQTLLTFVAVFLLRGISALFATGTSGQPPVGHLQAFQVACRLKYTTAGVIPADFGHCPHVSASQIAQFVSDLVGSHPERLLTAITCCTDHSQAVIRGKACLALSMLFVWSPALLSAAVERRLVPLLDRLIARDKEPYVTQCAAACRACIGQFAAGSLANLVGGLATLAAMPPGSSSQSMAQQYSQYATCVVTTVGSSPALRQTIQTTEAYVLLGQSLVNLVKAQAALCQSIPGPEATPSPAADVPPASSSSAGGSFAAIADLTRQILQLADAGCQDASALLSNYQTVLTDLLPSLYLAHRMSTDTAALLQTMGSSSPSPTAAAATSPPPPCPSPLEALSAAVASARFTSFKIMFDVFAALMSDPTVYDPTGATAHSPNVVSLHHYADQLVASMPGMLSDDAGAPEMLALYALKLADLFCNKNTLLITQIATEDTVNRLLGFIAPGSQHSSVYAVWVLLRCVQLGGERLMRAALSHALVARIADILLEARRVDSSLQEFVEPAIETMFYVLSAAAQSARATAEGKEDHSGGKGSSHGGGDGDGGGLLDLVEGCLPWALAMADIVVPYCAMDEPYGECAASCVLLLSETYIDARVQIANGAASAIIRQCLVDSSDAAATLVYPLVRALTETIRQPANGGAASGQSEDPSSHRAGETAAAQSQVLNDGVRQLMCDEVLLAAVQGACDSHRLELSQAALAFIAAYEQRSA